MKKIIFIALSTMLSVFTYGQTEVELMIASEKVNCSKDKSQACFKAKKTTDPSWTFEIENIEGFDFKSGFIYTLKIELINDPENPHNVTYKLIEVLKKEEK